MRRLNLSVKLPLLVLLAVVMTASASSLIAIFVGRGILRRQALEEDLSDAQIYTHAIELYLDYARSLLETAVGSPGISGLVATRSAGLASRRLPAGTEARERDVAARRLRHSKVFEYIMYLRPDGSGYLVEPYALEAELSRWDLGYTSWYEKVMRNRQTVISDLHISPVTQRPTVVIATPVAEADGRIVGIWAGGLRLDQLSRVGETGGERGTLRSYGYVTDSRGLIIAHQAIPKYVVEQSDFSSMPLVRAALGGKSGTMQFVNPIEGEEWLGAYVPLLGVGWAVVYATPLRVADAPIVSLTHGILAASAVLTVLVGLVGLAVARRIVRPLSELTSGTQAIAAGDLSRRIEVRTGDEIEHLAHEFNRMAAALSEKEAQLRQRAEQLEAANKELEAFSYSVSHDLRAPLRAMDGFSRILVQEYGSQLVPEAKRYLQIVRDNTKQMGCLVDDLLTFSRLGRQALKLQPVVPAELVRRVLEDLHGEQAGRRMEITVGDLPTCQADPALLKQVIVNLLSNALKFTRKRDPAVIEIGSTNIADCRLPISDLLGESPQSAIANHKSAIYYVRDNGVGFDMQYAHKLFGVFQRLHRAAEYEGTGVGLAIVQRIVHRHGGRVWAEAEVDKGATFYFRLQCTKAEGSR